MALNYNNIHNGLIHRKIRKKTQLEKIKQNVMSSVMNSFTKAGFKKQNTITDIIGCSFEDFMNHIENQFEHWMNWENYGKYNGDFNFGWDFDHKIPTTSALNEADILKINHYTNFQPLCSKINREIKKDIY